MIKRILALALVTGTAGCISNDAPVPFTVMDKGTVRIHSDITLEAEVAAAFAEFAANPETFGAMYVARDGVDWFWRTGTFSLADVELEARETCAALTRTTCIRYATITPANALDPMAIPTRIAPDLHRAMRRTQEGDYVALAVMPTGAYGYGFNYDTAQAAEARAMDECRNEVASEQADADPDTLPALISAGLYQCRILQTYRR